MDVIAKQRGMYMQEDLPDSPALDFYTYLPSVRLKSSKAAGGRRSFAGIAALSVYDVPSSSRGLA
jgi:hypothetical protein